ncbi:MAG: site-specific DNA-methyltransferase, partial [Eggerthellaceae bacterium]|nr:site-specific DNA-methyltransferase [Eggerthellaceae bacterium]
IGPTGYESRWICNPEGYEYFKSVGRIHWKKVADGDGSKWQVYQKFYLEDKTKAVSNLWNDLEGNKKATRDVRDIFGDPTARFDFPKPVQLIDRIIRMVTNPNATFLDSFAGSGTTAHAVLNANKADGGNRHFILVEMMDYAESITAERVKRVIDGYGEGRKAVEGTGGNFSYYELGEPIFNESGNLNEAVGVERICAYVWYSETGRAYTADASDHPYHLGNSNGNGYYFYYEPNGVTTLDYGFLSTITDKQDSYVIYADICAISDDELAEFGIAFKKIPRDIARL